MNEHFDNLIGIVENFMWNDSFIEFKNGFNNNDNIDDIIMGENRTNY